MLCLKMIMKELGQNGIEGTEIELNLISVYKSSLRVTKLLHRSLQHVVQSTAHTLTILLTDAVTTIAQVQRLQPIMAWPNSSRRLVMSSQGISYTRPMLPRGAPADVDIPTQK